MPDKDELFKGIDDAANNLFDQYIVKKPAAGAGPEAPVEAAPADPEPAAETPPVEAAAPEPPPEPVAEVPKPPEPTPEPVVEVPAAPEQPQSISLELEVESEIPPEENILELFSELDESLLTIDWEVNTANITTSRNFLAKLIAANEWTDQTPIGQVANQMDKVLASMFESPENSPISAPSQLKKASQVIRTAHDKGPTPDPEVRKILSTALSNLHAVLTPDAGQDEIKLEISDDFEAAMPIEDIPAPPAASELALEPQDLELSLESAPESPAAPEPAAPTAEEASFDFGMDLDLEGTTDPSGPGERVPEATTRVLKTYAKAISGSIKLITPMEKLFASKPSMAKLHKVNKHLREKLASQQDLLVGAFSSDYSSYSGFGTVHGWLESQLDVVGSCVKRIGKLEKLFGKTAGYEKLYNISKKVRKALERQQDAITVVVGGAPASHQFDLTGEYPAIIPPGGAKTAEVPAAAVSAISDPDSMLIKCIDLAKTVELGTAGDSLKTGLKLRKALEKIKKSLSGAALASPGAAAAASNAILAANGPGEPCRWDWLLKTTWAGQLVGLAPDQVAYESKTAMPIKSFRDMAYFSLKKLKSMPWSNLQNLFSGELAELDKATLNNMELEIAHPPATFVGSSKKKVYPVIMYSEGKGKIYLLDSPTEAISVAEEALWAPGGSSDSDIAGTLTVYGSTIPVVSVT
jgi:hypothetical protein